MGSQYNQLNEEQKVEYIKDESRDVLKVYNKIPYALIRQESDVLAEDIIDEFGEIFKYYKIYKKGKGFTAEGTNGDYVPAELKYRMAATLINKEARFLFAEQPDISINPKGDLATVTTEVSEALTVLNDLVKTVLDKNMFQDILVKAAKDCFIGKRVACLVNFNPEDGVTISFIPSTQFIYETKVGNQNVLTKFVCFIVVKDSVNLINKRIFKKKFVLEDDGKVYLEEIIYDGAGSIVETVTKKQPIKLPFIPASIFINDGLTGEKEGESEVELLMDYEMWYSKLSNADSDAQRKSMNPTKYTVDMQSDSTKNLSTGAGAYWDLGSDQNLPQAHPEVGLLEPKMNYSEALKTSLDRIKTSGYEQVDIPNLTLDTVQGVITSGKALKAIYWPLIVRCKEKMKMWGPRLSNIVDIIIQGAIVYPDCIKAYTNDIISNVAYEIDIEQNTPLPEDEIEEKTTNLAEVEASVISKKTYMKRWYGLTDDEVDNELYQIAYERQILEDSAYDLNNGYNGDNKLINMQADDFNMAGVKSIKSDGTDRHHADTINVKGNPVYMPETTGDVSDVQTSFTNSARSKLIRREQGTKSLNGTQMNSLVGILNNYKSGIIGRSQAITLIKALGMSEEFANSLIDEERKA